MSTHQDLYVMLCLPVPRELWAKDQPGRWGFSAQYEAMINVVHGYAPAESPAKPGTCGILYDGMNLEYCWFGIVLAHEAPWRGNYVFKPTAVEISPRKMITLYQDLCDVYAKTFWKRAPEEPQVRVIRHWH